MASYSEKLKDPRWQKKRLEIFQRDNFCCTLCQDDKSTLHVHHFEYSGDPWDADDNLLTTLCEICHKVIEHLKTSNIKPIKIFKVPANNDRWWLLVHYGSGVLLLYWPLDGLIIDFNSPAVEKIISFFKNNKTNG